MVEHKWARDKGTEGIKPGLMPGRIVLVRFPDLPQSLVRQVHRVVGLIPSVPLAGHNLRLSPMRTLTLVLLVLGAALAWFWHQAKQNPELSQKPDISRLQGIEFEHRGKDLDKPVIFVKESGTCSVGILATDRRTRAWLLLYSPTTTTAFRGVSTPYLVTQQQEEEIERECMISHEAKQELLKHINQSVL